jgi:hypothetical protein
VDWWLEHGFDGIVGGVVGGLATGLVLWVSIRHERRMAERNELRSQAVQFHSLCMRLNEALPPKDEPEAWNRWMRELWNAALVLRVMCKNRAPELVPVLEQLGDHLQVQFSKFHNDKPIEWPMARGALLIAAPAVLSWLYDPQEFDRKAKLRLTESPPER